MNESTLITFHCYQGDQAQVEFLLPEARKHGCHIVVFSPEDSKVVIPGVECRHAGKRAYIGQVSLDRQRYHLSMILEHPQQFYLMNDADSCCLSPEIPRRLYDNSADTIWSNEVTEPRPHLTPGLPKIAMQPPYFVSRTTLYKFLTAPIVPEHPITPYIDWWMLAQTYSAGLKHRNYSELDTDPPLDPDMDESSPDFVRFKERIRRDGMWHPVKSVGQLEHGKAVYRRLVEGKKGLA